MHRPSTPIFCPNTNPVDKSLCCCVALLLHTFDCADDLLYEYLYYDNSTWQKQKGGDLNDKKKTGSTVVELFQNHHSCRPFVKKRQPGPATTAAPNGFNCKKKNDSCDLHRLCCSLVNHNHHECPKIVGL